MFSSSYRLVNWEFFANNINVIIPETSCFQTVRLARIAAISKQRRVLFGRLSRLRWIWFGSCHSKVIVWMCKFKIYRVTRQVVESKLENVWTVGVGVRCALQETSTSTMSESVIHALANKNQHNKTFACFEKQCLKWFNMIIILVVDTIFKRLPI